MKRHNAIARDLRTPKYRPRIVRSRKLYSRKRDRKTYGPAMDQLADKLGDDA